MSGSRSTTSWSATLFSYLPSFLQSTPASPPPAPVSPAESQFWKKMRNAFIAHGCDALAMFLGTMAWMGVYYAEPEIETIDDGGYYSYVLHCLLMGIAANVSVLPLIYAGHRLQGEPKKEAVSAIKKYFVLCVIPDVLYEPTADFLIAIAKPGAFENFDFEKYADSSFEIKEMIGAFFLFGVSFGLIYYLGDKVIQRYSPPPFEDDDEEEDLTSDDAYVNRILRVVRNVLESSEISALKAALQYFIFYLTDYSFNVNWVTFQATMPQLIGVCGMMAAYTVVLDSFPEFLHLIEHCYYPHDSQSSSESRRIVSGLYSRNDSDIENSINHSRSVSKRNDSEEVELSASKPKECSPTNSPRLFAKQNGKPNGKETDSLAPKKIKSYSSVSQSTRLT